MKRRIDRLTSVVHMFVLGIDPGLTRMGYGLVRRGHPPVPVAVGVIRTSPDAAMSVRLAELYADLCALIAEHRPDAMAVEAVFTNKNLHTALAVSRASGMALLAAAQAGIPVTEYTPTAVKSAVTGDGSADKAMVATMVVRRLGLTERPKPADAADALAVAICHLQSARMRVGA
jgi:crossover junction endodeoxyribonuclease RuvC